MTCIGAVRPSVGSQGVWEAPLSNMREPSKLAHVLTHIEMIIFLCTLSKQLMGSYLDLTLWSSGCSKPTLIWGLWGSLRWCTADPRRRSSNLLTCKHLRAQTQVSAPFCSALGWWLSSQMPLVSQSTLLSGAQQEESLEKAQDDEGESLCSAEVQINPSECIWDLRGCWDLADNWHRGCFTWARSSVKGQFVGWV